MILQVHVISAIIICTKFWKYYLISAISTDTRADERKSEYAGYKRAHPKGRLIAALAGAPRHTRRVAQRSEGAAKPRPVAALAENGVRVDNQPRGTFITCTTASNSKLFNLEIDVSALYLIAAPKTPDRSGRR